MSGTSFNLGRVRAVVGLVGVGMFVSPEHVRDKSTAATEYVER